MKFLFVLSAIVFSVNGLAQSFGAGTPSLGSGTSGAGSTAQPSPLNSGTPAQPFSLNSGFAAQPSSLNSGAAQPSPLNPATTPGTIGPNAFSAPSTSPGMSGQINGFGTNFDPVTGQPITPGFGVDASDLNTSPNLLPGQDSFDNSLINNQGLRQAQEVDPGTFNSSNPGDFNTFPPSDSVTTP